VVGHIAGPHRGGDGLAQVGFGRTAVFAFAAFGDVERNDVIAGFQPLDAGAAFDHFAAAFMAENAGKRAFRVVAGQGEGIGMADASGHHFQQHLAFLGAFHIDFFDHQRFLRLPGHGGACFHSEQISSRKLSDDDAHYFAAASACSRSAKNVVDVLDADGQPHQILADPGSSQFRLAIIGGEWSSRDGRPAIWRRRY
jgi:hypothetical protein